MSPNRDVGITFVEMMFAVAVGDAAAQIAKAVGSVQHGVHTIMEMLPAFSHLLLTIVVIAMSWVGWSHSKSTATYIADSREVLARWPVPSPSFPFGMLLLDVLLVVFYFILSEAADLNDADNDGQIDVSARPEAFWLIVVFSTYFLWNAIICCHEWQRERTNDHDDRGWRMGAAACAAALCLWAFYWSEKSCTTLQAVLIDIALLFAALLFRVRFSEPKDRKRDFIRGGILVFAAIALLVVAR